MIVDARAEKPPEKPPEPKPSLKRLSVLRRLIGLMAPHKGRFALATISLFIGSGLGANPEFAKLLIDCGVQWLQAGNDFEYMIRACEQTFAQIRSETSGHPAVDSYGQKL